MRPRLIGRPDALVVPTGARPRRPPHPLVLRDEHRPFGYRCSVARGREASSVRCTARADRVVTFRFYRD